jgi:hypothetical protein
MGGDTIVVAGQLAKQHRIDAPEVDQAFQWGSRSAVRWSSGTGTAA